MASRNLKRWLEQEEDLATEILKGHIAIYKTFSVVSNKVSHLEKVWAYRLAVIRQALALAKNGRPDCRIDAMLDNHGADFRGGVLVWQDDSAEKLPT